jgi:Outer membrane protein beta-barrel domain
MQMRKLGLVAAALGVFLAMQLTANAQAVDVGLGFGSLLSPSAASASGDHYPQAIRGGLYPSVRADIFLKKHLGFNGEVAWRARQDLYLTPLGFVPFRPILYDFNAVVGSRFNKNFGADAMAGIGGEDLRFYQPYYNCGFTGCTNYTSSSHFLGHIGGDVRLYVHGNFFVRPEVHYYMVRNNNEFSSNHETRLTIGIGYSFFGNQSSRF